MEEFTPKESGNRSVTKAKPHIKSLSPDEVSEEVASGEALVIAWSPSRSFEDDRRTLRSEPVVTLIGSIRK